MAAGMRDHQEAKARWGKVVLEQLDLERLGALDSDSACAHVLPAVRAAIEADAASLTLGERERLSGEVLHEIIEVVLGLGPLEPLLKDDSISDILVNGCDRVYVERRGLLYKTGVRFQSDRHLLQIIERIVARVGRRIDDASPAVDARLPDGSRVNAIIPPLAVGGPCLSIRRFGRVAITAAELVRLNSLTPAMLELLEIMVRGRLNILVSGAAGSGKTTLLNVLSAFISESERVITIEDPVELQLKQEHVLRLEVRPPNIDGQGAVRQRELVINALRMRPDRIIVGEVRGEEAFDMLQAMNTGHDGSITTLHANAPRDALSRIEAMVGLTGMNVPDHSVRRHVASAIQAIVHVARFSDGTRKVVSISEISGMESDIILMQEIFRFERTGAGPEGHVLGEFRCMGIRPRLADRLEAAGLHLRPELFDPTPAGPGRGRKK